jgi:hypothetical protein
MCEKVVMRYREAKTLVNRYRKGHARGRVPIRVYYCQYCKAWHVTSHKIEPRRMT